MITIQYCYPQEKIGVENTILSPNAESFKVYGDIPVSLYTGIPQISVPIYSYQTEYINLDISLSYHASGFKPNVHPSWVGLGWNLNTGGIITRDIKYIPDEINSRGTYECSNGETTNVGGIGFYHSHNILNKEKWYEPADFYDTNNEFSLFTFMIDKQPDVFSFNMLGYSGKFYINHLGEWKVQCDVPIKVEFNNDDLISGGFQFTTPTFTKFTLTDGMGVKYIFGGADAIEYSVSMLACGFDYSREGLATSWLLTEIIPPVGESIRFEYERGPFQSNFSCFIPSRIVKREPEKGSTAHDYVLQGASGTIISPVYLKSISIPDKNLQILFKTSKSNELSYYESNYTDLYWDKDVPPKEFLGFSTTSQIPYFDRNYDDMINASRWDGKYKDRFIWLKLDEISFEYPFADKTRKILFKYYEWNNHRLRLDEVSMGYPKSDQKEIYQFRYYYGDRSFLNEPEYLSEYGDHWGYSNQKYLWIQEDKNNKPQAPLINSSHFGVLSKIIYPTKGYSDFYYENHDYGGYVRNEIWSSSYISARENEMVGGLRIKKIVDVDELGGFSSKEYIYTKIEYRDISSGIINYELKPYTKSNSDFFHSSSIHVGYSTVIEKYSNGSFVATNFISQDHIVRLGETVPACTDDLPKYVEKWTTNLVFNSRDLERGKESDKYYCDPSGKVLKSIHYEYENIGKDETNIVRTANPKYMASADPSTSMLPGHIANYYYCYFNKLKSTREILYDKNAGIYYGNSGTYPINKAVISMENFEYDNYGQLVKKSIETNMNKEEVVIKYPYSGTLPSEIHTEMYKRHMLSYPVLQESYVNNIYKNGLIYDYALYNNNKHILQSSLTDIYRNWELAPRLQNKYNDYGKLIERKYRDGSIESYLWSNDNKLIIASVQNANIDKVDSVFQSSSNKWDWDAIVDDLRLKLPNAYVKSYKYLYNGKLKSETDNNNKTINYEYDENERLCSIKNNEENILRSIGYNYSSSYPKTHLNKEIVINVTRPCPEGFISKETAKFKIPAGVCLSTISQEDADNKARELYHEAAQRHAEEKCQCIRAGFYAVDPNEYFGFASSNIYYEGNDLYIYYFYIIWGENFFRVKDNTYDFYTGGVPIGKLRNPEIYPKQISYVEFIDRNNVNKQGEKKNTWILWVDTNGTIRARLKNYQIDAEPKPHDAVQFTNLIFSLHLDSNEYILR